MALAVIASLLLVALLVLLSVVVVRRHYLSGPGSLNPLLRVHATKGSPGQDNDGFSNSGNIGRGRNYNDSMNNGTRTPMSSVYLHNNARNIRGPNGGQVVINQNPENTSLSGSINRLDEPPYERVRTRSEHSYETIRKLNQNSANTPNEDSDETPYLQHHEPSYERLAGDKGSLWYESVDKSSVGYETVPGDRRHNTSNQVYPDYQTACKECMQLQGVTVCDHQQRRKDPGYEKISDHQYETLKDKDPGYERLRDKSDVGYESMLKDGGIHGYETVRDKSMEGKCMDDRVSNSDYATNVPDILQGIGVEDDDNREISPVASVPPEILALYAQVDKSKKKKNLVNPDSHSNNPSRSNSVRSRITTDEDSIVSSSTRTESQSTRPTPPPRPKGMAPQPPDHQPLHHTYSETNSRHSRPSLEDISRPPSSASEYTSPTGTLRPLPPIPKQ